MGSKPSTINKPLSGREFPERQRMNGSVNDWLGCKKANDQKRLGFDEKHWVINGKVYDLIPFMDKHPGGSSWLQMCQGMDCTGLFETYHLNIKSTSALLSKYYIKDIEFIGYVSSSIHAVSVVSVSLIMIFNYSEKDLLEININDQNNIKIPFIFNLFRYLTIFQSSFFVIDSLQMLFLYHHKTWSYRIGMTLHHLFCLLCTCCIYYFEDPYIIYIYAYNTLLEISTCFLNLRYFAVQFKYETLYFYSGIGLLILYPSTRIAITIYCSYTAYYGVLHLIFGNSIVAVIVSTNAFILLLSAYHTKVLYSNPKKSIYSKRDQENRVNIWIICVLCISC